MEIPVRVNVRVKGRRSEKKKKRLQAFEGVGYFEERPGFRGADVQICAAR